jgi:hypothetical protein
MIMISYYILHPTKVVSLKKPLMVLVCKLLAQLVREHPANQLEVFEYKDLLLSSLSQNVGVEYVLANVFYNNQQIAEQVDFGEVIAALGEEIVAEFPKRVPGYIRVLENLVVVNGVVVSVAKQRLIELFRDAKFKKMGCTYAKFHDESMMKS